MTNNKAREINSPIIKQLINETSPEELAKIDAEMTNNKQQILDELYAYVDSMQNTYVELLKKDKKKSKEVNAILTATTLIKMKIQALNK
jgi:3-hydroxy-3-methylglutaryl CoA synthase